MNKLLIFLVIVISGCKVWNGDNWQLKTTVLKKKQLETSLSSLNVSNNILTLTGQGFNSVTEVKIVTASGEKTFNIISKSDSTIRAMAIQATQFAVGEVLSLIISNADAQTSYPITFSLQDGAVTASKLSSMGATTGQVLKYNGNNWVPSTLSNSQIYLGAWNASNNTPDISTLGQFQAGDYYIVSTAGSYGGITFNAGDWVMFNGTAWEKIDNSSNVVSSFNGRRGIVSLLPSDYVSLKDHTTHKLTGSSINDFADVDTSGLAANKILKYDGSKWIVADDNSGGGSGSVGTTELQDNAVTTTKLANASVSYSKLNLNDGDIPQVKVNGLVTGLAGKEPTVTAGTTSQYYRGDKTWQTLNSAAVTEATNLYFTNARVLGVPLTGFTTATGAIVATDTVLAGFNKAQGQINSLTTSLASTNTTLSGKADTTNIAQTITAASVTGLSAPSAGSDAVNKTYVDNLVTAGSNSWTSDGSGNVYRSSGKVGIGTNTPTTKLHISNGSLTLDKDYYSSGVAINYGATSSGGGPAISAIQTAGQGPLSHILVSRGRSDGEGGYSYTTTGDTPSASTPDWFSGLIPDYGVGGSYRFAIVEKNGTTNPRLVINPGGNVGIGAVAPRSKLEVTSGAVNTNADNAGVLANFTGPTQGGQGSSISLESNDAIAAGTGGILGFGGRYINNSYANWASIKGLKEDGVSGNFGGYLAFFTRTNSYPSAERLRIDSFGNVGIGTTSPSNALDVQRNGKTGIQVRDATANQRARLELNGLVGTGLYIGGIDSSPLLFGTNYSEQMRLNTNGNVGIGTTTPSQKLDVNGNINGTQLCIAGTCKSAWPTGVTAGGITDTEISATANIAQSKINGLTTALSGKEPTITAGTTAQYLRGDKSLSTFASDVIATLLTGLSTATNAVITSADSVVQAFGKLQAQISGQATTLTTKADLTNISQTITAATVTGLTAPVAGSDAVNKSYVDGFGQWSTSSGNVYRASGNVGIGTTSPTTKLDVSGNINSTGTIYSANIQETQNNGLQLYVPYNSVAPRVSFYGGTGSKLYVDTSSQSLYPSVAGGYSLGSTTNPFGAAYFNGNVVATTFNSQILTNNGQTNSLSVGAGSSVTGAQATAIGFGANANGNNIALGFGASSTASGGVAIGYSSTSAGNSVSVGNGANSSVYGVAIGNNAKAGGYGVAVGLGADAQTSVSTAGIALGRGAITQNNVFVAGGPGASLGMYDSFLGSGMTDTTPISHVIHGTGGSGTDIAGANLSLAGGRGTGAAAGGFISFQTSSAGASGTSLNSLSERMRITSSGNVGVGTTTPGGTLDVKSSGTTSSSYGLIVRNATPTTNFYVRDDGQVSAVNNKFQIDPNGYVSANGKMTVYNNVNSTNVVLAVKANGAQVSNIQEWQNSAGTALTVVDKNGNVGIGTASPSYTLHVNGSVAGTSAYNNLSDVRLKKEIEVIPNSLEKLISLDGVFYKWKVDEYPDKKLSERREMGVIAQKVEKVFPEAVSKDKDGIRSVAYSMLIAPIINSVKDMYQMILNLGARINSIEKRNDKIQTELAQKDKEISELKSQNEVMNHRLSILENKLNGMSKNGRK